MNVINQQRRPAADVFRWIPFPPNWSI